MSALIISNDTQRRTLIDASVARIKRLQTRIRELQAVLDKEVRHRNQLLDGYGEQALAEAADAAMRDAEESLIRHPEDNDSQIDDSHDGIFG